MQRAISSVRSRYRLIVVVLLVVIFGLLGWNYLVSQARQAELELQELDTYTVSTGTLNKLVFASGKVVSQTESAVYSEEVGPITKINVQVGDVVADGEVVAEIKATDRLGEEFTHTPFARVAGTVTEVNAQLGQIANSQTPLVTIVDTTALQAEVEVTEADLPQIKLKQIVTVSFAPDSIAAVKGTVRQIAPAPTATSATTSNPVYIVTIAFAKKPAELQYGMTVDAEIITETKTDVLVVDDVYVYSRDGQDYVKRLVETPEDTRVEEVEVQVGFVGETSLEIATGLAAGDQLVLPTTELRARRPVLNSFLGGR